MTAANHPSNRAPRVTWWIMDPVPWLDELCPRCLVPSLIAYRCTVTDHVNPTVVIRQGWRIECLACTVVIDKIDAERPAPEQLPT